MVSIPISNTLIFFSCILISAFFSAAETAYTAVNKARLHHIAKEDSKKWSQIEKMYQDPKRVITTILIGNNISNVAASAVATSTLLLFFEQIHFPFNNVIRLSVITSIVTVILLTLGEITPKVFALKKPESTVLLFSPVLRTILKIFTPVIKILDILAYWIKKALGVEASVSEKPVLLEEMKMILELGREEGLLEKEKSNMLAGVFDISDTVVREIMTPRTDTVCINVNKAIDDAFNLFIEKGHSRIPVFEDRVDNILGILYAKDLLKQYNTANTANIRQLIRKAVFIPESKTIDTALQQMKRAKIHLAVVVDEYGGVSGIVTMEDIIEEILGDIQDEYDLEDGKDIKKISQDTYLVNAKINIKDLGEHILVDFPETDEYDTLGGFLLSRIGKLPEQGEKISYENLNFLVKEIKNQRIIKLEMSKTDLTDSKLSPT